MKTQELEERICQEALFDAELIANNAAPTFSAFLVECAERAEIKRSDIIRALNVDRNYGYQLINGTRMPARPQVLRMALLLRLDVSSAQKLLNLAGREALYVRRPEDARVVYCLEHDTPYEKACAFVWGE